MGGKKLIIMIYICLFQVVTNGLSQNATGAQQDRYISGRITDANDGETIIGASVFLDNTTIGITTDMDGRYRFRIPGEGSYLLTVSHVGYESVIKEIEPGRTSLIFDAALNTIELEELTVSAGVRFRRTDINLFWNTILGKNPSRRTIQAANPESVYYYYDPETKILKVTCHEPLQIVNNETGYHIQYVLDYFTHDYNTGFTDWRYQSFFQELEPQNLRQKNNWEKNRKEVYDVSLTKFIKSLYNNTLLNDGFLLADINLNADPSNPFVLSVLSQDEILSAVAPDKSKTINLNRMVLLFCYGKQVTQSDLARLQTSQQTSQQKLDPIGMPADNVNLLQEYERTRLLSERDQFVKDKRSAFQQFQQIINTRTVLDDYGRIRNTLQGESIRIFPDGSFTNTLSLGRINNSGSLSGLSLKLPVDYSPESSALSALVTDLDENKTLFDDIAQHFDEQLNVFPQEKIHLHTDRDLYVPGEKIWFNVYLTDAATHQPVSNSRYVYVELISPVDTLVSRVMIRPENELFHGHLFLSEMIPADDYTLRAYTRSMENLGDDYFFKKNIRIGNITSPPAYSGREGARGGESAGRNLISRDSRERIQEDYGVSFFPEGGNLVEGVWNTVALKALNRNGYPETISGEIVDGNGSLITSLQTFHAGMGVFSYVPEAGKRYFLQCRNENGLAKQFELPPPDIRAYALTVSQQNGKILVGVRQSVGGPDIPCYLLAHCRGMVLYFDSWNPENRAIVFSEEELPVGVIQFVLFDEQMNPLSERLAFSKNYEEEKIAFHTDKSVYQKRAKVLSTLSLPPSLSEKDGVRMSISITDNADTPIDSTTTILSTLLLSSELKGYIENPAWYLQDDIKSSTALDYLMMTHGWRRYSIPEVVKGNPSYPRIEFQTSQEISGQVISPVRSRPVSGGEVLILLEDSDFGLMTTDENGRFLFKDFEYPDSTSYFLRALSHRGSDRNELVLDNQSFPKPVHAPQSPIAAIHQLREETPNDATFFPRPVEEGQGGADAFIAKAEQRSMYDEDMRLIHLSEVEVTAPKIERQWEPRLQYWANSSSDMTIRADEIKRSAARTATEFLRLNAGSGVRVYPDGIISIRGAYEFFKYLPLIIIDGMPYEWDEHGSPLELVMASEIESIDVFKGVSTALFGTRGAGGVISVTTIQGRYYNAETEKPNYTVFTPLGYQKPVEFYSPVYETLESKHLTIPDYRTTIFWKPDIIISEDEDEAAFEFYTSDFSTTYSVVIEGLTTDGRIIRQVEKIQVE